MAQSGIPGEINAPIRKRKIFIPGHEGISGSAPASQPVSAPVPPVSQPAPAQTPVQTAQQTVSAPVYSQPAPQPAAEAPKPADLMLKDTLYRSVTAPKKSDL